MKKYTEEVPIKQRNAAPIPDENKGCLKSLRSIIGSFVLSSQKINPNIETIETPNTNIIFGSLYPTLGLQVMPCKKAARPTVNRIAPNQSNLNSLTLMLLT